MRSIHLAIKDWRQTGHDIKTVFFLVIMPLMFTAFFGYTFGGNQTSDVPRPVVGLAIHDSGALGRALATQLYADDTVQGEELAAGEEDALTWAGAVEQVRRGELAAAVEIPSGFSVAALADGGSGTVRWVADVQTSEGQVAQAALERALGRVNQLAVAARFSAAAQEPFTDQAAHQAYLEAGVALAERVWAERLPVVRLETRVQPAAAESAENPFDRFSPGMLVQFVLFGLTQSATALVLERRSGTWDRLLMTPLTRGGLVLGKLLSLLGLVLAQALILIVAGQFLFGVDYMRAPLATLLLAVALSVWVAALGVLIGVLARNEGQALAVAMMAMFAFSALGGAWFPLEVAGETFAAVARLLPAAWAMDGFQDILLRGGGLADVVPAVGVVMGYAVLCLGLAVWRLRRA